MPLSPNFGGLVEGGKSGKGGKKSPFFPARVKEIILQPSTDVNSLFVQNNGYPSIGYISFHPLNSVVDTQNPSNLIAAPLQINIRRLPLVNEVVLILQSTDILNEDPQAQKYYYFSNVNIWNSIHHNGFPDLQNLDATQKQSNLVGFVSSTDGIVKKLDQSSKDLFLGNTFVEDPEIRNLFPIEGDVLVEGRFGNSLRFSHTAKSPSGSIQNPWSNQGLPTQPITIIRNGQTKQTPPIRWTPIFEDINGDASSIYLTNEQEIQMDFSSQNLASYGLALTSSFNVVQIPNITIQAADKSLASCDINELSDAEETIEVVNNPPVAYDISSSLSNVTSSAAPTTTTQSEPPTASLSPTVTKTVTSGPGSSKQTAIPEQQLGPLTWAGEEVQALEYQDNYAQIEEDESQYWDKNPPDLKVPSALEKFMLPIVTPPPAGGGPAGGGPTGGGPSGTSLTPAQLAEALKLSAAGLDVIPGNYLNNAKSQIILAAVGSQCIEINAAKAFWVMFAAALADKVRITVNSGFRPPFQAVTVTSSKGVKFNFTSQLQLRTVDRWRGSGPFDNNAIYNAGASSFYPATAAPGKSQHGNGVAIDINTGGFPTKNPSASQLSDVFTWMATNGWKYGFVRSVSTEAWHWEYHPQAITAGPYYKFGGKPDKIFSSITKVAPFAPYNGKTINMGNLYFANKFGLNT